MSFESPLPIPSPAFQIPPAKGNKRALLVEGGGMKGAFAGGVLFGMKEKFSSNDFDLVVGVSSGACSAAYFVTFAKNQLRLAENALAVWYRDLSGKKLISLLNPFRGKTFLDQEYLVDFIFRDKVRLPAENLGKKNHPEFRIAVSNLKTHGIEYVKATKENIFDLLKAATSLPIATRGKRWIAGKLYSDAAILNPLPLQDLIAAGYKEIFVVMNSPLHAISKPLGFLTSHLAFPKMRKVRKLMRKWHHVHFNGSRSMAVQPPPGVKIYTIAPRQKLPVGLVSTEEAKLWETVQLGVQFGKEASPPFL